MYGFKLNEKENIFLVCKIEVGQGKQGIMGVVKKGHYRTQQRQGTYGYPVGLKVSN